MIGDEIYRCKKCNTKVTIIEMPCGVSGPGCKDKEVAYCPGCGVLLGSRMIAGVLVVRKTNE